MSFCEGVTVCPRCGGMHVSASPLEERARRQREKEIATSQNPVQERSVNLMCQTNQRHVIKQCDQSKQTGREHEKNSQQAEQAGGDQGDDEDKEGDQEEEESDSEEETEEEEEINQTSPGTIRIAVLNVRSMNPRTSRISELIRQDNLDVLLTTETWLTDDTADRLLREASPEGFRFHYQVRTDGRRGGGVANQFSQELQGEQIHFDFLNMETFEFVVTVLQHDGWDQPVVIINLYHPPGYDKQRFHRFLNEFQSLLDEVKKNYSSIIVTGDFNIHVNNERRSFTDEFYHVWPQYNLTQHVEEPTHRAGNTLDLVLTSNVETSDLIVQKDTNSDHSTVYFTAKPKDTRRKLKKTRTKSRNDSDRRRNRN